MSGRRPGAGPETVLYAAWAPFFSGAERALLILLDHLDRSRYRPVVAVGTHGELERELATRGITTVHVPVVYSGVRTAVPWVGVVSRLVRLCRRERVRLVHANDVPSYQPAGYAARWLGRPAVAHVRFPDSREGYEWFLKPGFDRALFVSNAFKDEEVAKAPALFGGRAAAVHDAVQVHDQPDAEGIRRIRADLGLPIDGTIVALTGQVAEVKGIWEFIDAAAALVARGVPASFAVLGDDLKGRGALRARAEKVAAERGLSGRMHFLGYRENAPRLIAAFDIVAVPSHIEPFGLAAVEAMAAGRPVVGSRVGGIPETVVHGETGLLVPRKDSEALAAALEVLVREPARARAMGAAGRRRAARVFSPRAHAERVQAEYESVTGRADGLIFAPDAPDRRLRP